MAFLRFSDSRHYSLSAAEYWLTDGFPAVLKFQVGRLSVTEYWPTDGFPAVLKFQVV
jgi:hypothetical protein